MSYITQMTTEDQMYHLLQAKGVPIDVIKKVRETTEPRVITMTLKEIKVQIGDAVLFHKDLT